MRPRQAKHNTAEHRRLAESPTDDDPWRLWGPYVAGRQWGTVREDYSADGDAWASFPFDQAHTRAYRWGEDGISGLCDRYGCLNLAVALWNGQDDRLKERWFGVTNPQGNHGEDVKEFWWDLDATPTHSYAQQLYRYPQAAYPYAALVEGNAARGLEDPELELADTGVLEGGRFFDVVTTHAKGSPDDICIRITAINHGPDAAPLDLVPQLWFRNTWSWGRDDRTPWLRQVRPPEFGIGGAVAIEATHGLPAYEWDFDDVNPPVHAWAAWQVFLADGGRDHESLVRIASKLLLTFGWWVNKTDPTGNQLFSGGFLGMDNIGPFDRSHGVPEGWVLEQSDGTSWMAFFCLSMLTMTFQLARRDDAWDDLATTFTERFVAIAEAMDAFGPDKTSLWNEEDGFFYDVLARAEAPSETEKLRVRSMVGLLPLMAVAVAPAWVENELVASPGASRSCSPRPPTTRRS